VYPLISYYNKTFSPIYLSIFLQQPINNLSQLDSEGQLQSWCFDVTHLDWSKELYQRLLCFLILEKLFLLLHDPIQPPDIAIVSSG